MSAYSFTAAKLQSYREQWTVIGGFRNSSGRQFMAGNVLVSQPGPPDAFYNLPVVLAFSLLDEVLSDLASAGAFKTPPFAMLGKKMKDAKNSLPWVDYKNVSVAKGKRNDLAYKGRLMTKADCLRIVDLVAAELTAFGAITQ